MNQTQQKKELIDVAAGRRPADWVIKNARVVNVASHEIVTNDVAIFGGRIAGLGQYESSATFDAKGRYVCPGFIDAHVHIESSLLAPGRYAEVVTRRGTTGIVADPHEFANVWGVEGIEYVLRSTDSIPLDVFVMLSSCVPASGLETAGATLEAGDLMPLLDRPRVLGLAEVMNYPGVISGDSGVLAKIVAASGRIIDGHAPGLSGRDLNAYAAAGIMSDHECITAEEGADKLRAGLHVMIREGSQTRNLAALLPLIKPETADRFMFCTDDKDVRDLLDEGHIDYMVRTAIAGGLDPILAIKLASYNTARYFGLRDVGAVLPGYVANLAVLEDLRACKVAATFHHGQLVARDGQFIAQAPPVGTRPPGSVRVGSLGLDDFAVAAPPGSPPRIHVIRVLENRIDTERFIEAGTVRDGRLVADPARDLAKICVIERHRASGRIGRAFVTGFGLRGGAIASTVAHDAHNLIVVGTNDTDMLAAAKRLVELQGGQVVVSEGKVLAELPLPIAGLVSDDPPAAVAERLRALSAAAKNLGCPLTQPFMALSFLSLSVIGKLKLTDQGLIDVERFAPIALTA